MSIIHDALKKVQQEQAGTPENIFAAPRRKTTARDDELPIEHLASSPKKARSILALLCAIAFTLGSLVFCYKQLHPYINKAGRMARSSYYKFIHKDEPPAFKTKAPEDRIPLAKINVNPPKPLNLPSPTETPAIPVTANPNPPETLNVHGVMSNGPNNLVLINDQVYQEGDDVDGVKIIKINLDSIIVNNNGKEETIRVKS